MDRAYLLMGGNLGDRVLNLKMAVQAVQVSVGNVISESHLYETAAWGITDQPSFLNKVLLVETTCNPAELLHALLKIEEQIGRKRLMKFGPRTIDIDILFFSEAVIETNDLSIPHPEIQNRRFALVPMAEIAPNFMHPVLKKSIKELLGTCRDKLDVKVFSC